MQLTDGPTLICPVCTTEVRLQQEVAVRCGCPDKWWTLAGDVVTMRCPDLRGQVVMALNGEGEVRRENIATD